MQSLCAIAVEPPGAGWSQGAGGQRGVAGFEKLGIEPGFAQQMWLGACRLLRTQTSAGDRTDLLGRGSVTGAWACRSNPRYTSLLPPFWKKGSSCPSAWKGVCGNDLKPAARVSFRVKLWCGRRGVRVQGEWGGRGKQASVCVAPVWVWVCYECCDACGRIRAIRASVSLKRETKESGVLCSRSWMKLFYSGSAKRF